jgi:exodeoxyribonuclease VII large subunit
MSRVLGGTSGSADRPDKSMTGSADRAMTVAALAQRISEGITEALPQTIRVVGELSGVTDRTHLYFDLTDAAAVVNCVMFASSARRSRYRPESGQQVVVTGRVEFHTKSGRVSILVDRVEPVGVGADEQAFRELFEALKRLGWFDPSKKKLLPIDPRRVAVVTSGAGAALQDVLVTMRKRCPSVDVAIVDVRVQGDRAVVELVRAITALSTMHKDLGLDAIIITRGGGSKEDLAAFNDRRVAEAIHRCKVPVVAAIGHETDTSIAELVADERAATPTQAAMRLTPDSAALAEQLDAVTARLSTAIRRTAEDARTTVEGSSRHLASAARHRMHQSSVRAERVATKIAAQRPAAVLARRGERLRHTRMRLAAAMQRRVASGLSSIEPSDLVRAMRQQIESARHELAAGEARLVAVSPVAVLQRGFSITSRSDGTVVRRADQVKPGDRVNTRVASGGFASTVDDPDSPNSEEATSEPSTPAPPSQAPPKPRRRSTKANPEDLGMDLFGSDG